MATEQCSVLIVGCGPAGMATAILLANQGIDSVIVEKRGELHGEPQAHVISARTREILAEMGLSEECTAPLESHVLTQGAFINWRSQVSGPDLACIDIWQDDYAAQYARSSRFPVTNIPQHHLERLMYVEALKRPQIKVLFNVGWESCDDQDDRVSSTVVHQRTGVKREITSQFLIGADGASSAVRRRLGIRMDGETDLAHLISVSFEADMRKHIQKPTLIYWLMNPRAPGGLIVHDPAGLAVFMTPYSPPTESPKDFPFSRCERMVKEALGDDSIEVKIRAISSWVMQCHVAEHYGQGSVFLVGDSAHRYPPTGGLGLNAGAADAHNIAWKLAMVLKGKAGRELLGTYGAERRPVAVENGRISLRNHQKMDTVMKAAGLDGNGLSTLAKVRTNSLAKIAPGWLKNSVKALLFGRISARLNQVGKASGGKWHQEKQKIQQAADQQFEHFNVIGLDLGHVYASNAIIADAGKPPRPENHVLQYVQSFCPGARMPHFRLCNIIGASTSHELVSASRFLLLGYGDAGRMVQGLARDLSSTIGYEVRGCDLEKHAPPDELAAIVAYNDNIRNALILVRPDGHVGWRCDLNATDNPQQRLLAVLGKILCKDFLGSRADSSPRTGPMKSCS